MTDIGWTPERIITLTDLWGHHHTASQIATICGGGLTKNAVIGKARRLGLELIGHQYGGRGGSPNPKNVERRKQERRERHKLYQERARRAQGIPKRGERAVWKTAGLVAPNPEHAVTFGQLTADTCRWPLGNPCGFDTSFCGGKPSEGKPYCAFHCRIAYTPVAERREHRPTYSVFFGYRTAVPIEG